jgi:hypothetical protein
MASLYIKAENLSVGDTLLLPMGKVATIIDIKPFGPRSIYVKFLTDHGWSRVERDRELNVKAQVVE